LNQILYEKILSMHTYQEYLKEINERKDQGLHPKPIDGGELLSEIIDQIKDPENQYRKDSLSFFIYNVVPGTTSAAEVKAAFLKDIISGKLAVEEITPAFALELISHMKGGPSIRVLIDLALASDFEIAKNAARVLKTQIFLYDADMARLEEAFKTGNKVAKEILQSYSKAEFFTELPDVEEEIEIVTFIAGEGDISTDLLSPGADAHSRSDRELHGHCIFEHNKEMQAELTALKEKHPDKRVMLIAEKGTMGVGSSRMSGVNNVALWTGTNHSRHK
jgi:aconitate hydratase 2/2-methylisocitrate dehydratase